MALKLSTQKLVSILGATIILGTFVVKEARKDKLKDLIDSVDAAENAYMIRIDDRKNYMALQQLSDVVKDFRAHPTKPVSMSEVGGGSSSFEEPTEIDMGLFESMAEQELSNRELIDTVARLARKLPESRSTLRLDTIYGMDSSFWNDRQNALTRANGLRATPPKYVGQKGSVIDEMQRLLSMVGTVADDVETESRKIISDAEEERSADEARYKCWTTIFYFLYGLGWLISVLGIFMGGTEVGAMDVSEDI